MATTIDQQTALDESLVPSTQRLIIGRSNFRLPSDIQSKEATLQVVYDAKALALTVLDCLKLKCFGDFITGSTLTLPTLSGKILCIRWNTKIRREAMK
uniref:Uncharacterized protein n=1 Tax=Tanacetum cinerariifolium TaxID=118510 RepID=A0A699RR08_TANCI|nr:hypothetical protein [Tanacetum cinerariifolium]